MTAPNALISPAMAVPSTYYRSLLAAFTARGWQAEALPRRGFEADRPRASRHTDWSYADEIADTQAAVDAARAQSDGPVILVGHSLGGQLAAGVQLGSRPADALVLIGTSLPHHRYYPMAGLPLLGLARSIPAVSAACGHVPKPWFGGPGARTLMREWAKIVVTGRPPYAVPQLIQTPTLAIQLEGDTYSVAAAARHFEQELIAPAALTRWEYLAAEAPPGGNTHHVFWARSPEPVVDQIVAWWSTVAP